MKNIIKLLLTGISKSTRKVKKLPSIRTFFFFLCCFFSVNTVAICDDFQDRSYNDFITNLIDYSQKENHAQLRTRFKESDDLWTFFQSGKLISVDTENIILTKSGKKYKTTFVIEDIRARYESSPGNTIDLSYNDERQL